ncbi:MAG: hypothetical protein ABR927_18605, partial [Bacteroidales bacterium]
EKIYLNVATGVKSPKRQNKFRRQGLTPEQSQRLFTTQIYIQSLTDEKRLKNPAEKLIDAMF